jgi:hypothetical protein
MDEPVTSSRTGMGLRAGGFLVTVVGSLLLGVGALLGWISVGVRGIDTGDVTPVDRGVDMPEGVIALALAVIALVAVLVTRIGGTGSARRGAAFLVLAAGWLAVAVVGATLATGPGRAADREVSSFAESVGVEVDELPGDLREALEGRAEPGLYLSFIGAMLTGAGGVMTLAWATRRDDRPPPEGPPDEPRHGPADPA